MRKVVKVERSIISYFCDVCGEELITGQQFHCHNCGRDLCFEHIAKDVYLGDIFCPLCIKIICIRHKKQREVNMKSYMLLDLVKRLHNKKRTKYEGK